MYPVIRLIKERFRVRGAALALSGTHVSRHICWPWDLDLWMELNNGRTLTLYDLGRLPMMIRLGFISALASRGWGLTVAGASVRYRRRIRPFHRFETRSRVLGWDQRFLYVEQSMWRRGEALNHILVRLAATDQGGILTPKKLIAAAGHKEPCSPALPDWVAAWVEADGKRPWPPMAG